MLQNMDERTADFCQFSSCGFDTFHSNPRRIARRFSARSKFGSISAQSMGPLNSRSNWKTPVSNLTRGLKPIQQLVQTLIERLVDFVVNLLLNLLCSQILQQGARVRLRM